MKIGVTEITEKDYYIDIDTTSMSDEEENNLYEQLSYVYGDDIDAITSILDEMQISYEKYEESTNSRIETERY